MTRKTPSSSSSCLLTASTAAIGDSTEATPGMSNNARCNSTMLTPERGRDGQRRS